MQIDNTYNGILLVNKPTGLTSHDVVAKLRRILGLKKIGHTGTLDKSASGLLVVCLGRATKTAQFISDADKSYDAVIALGRSSKTYDAEGVDFSKPENTIPVLDTDKIDSILEQFRGNIKQTVPAYSAVHVDGKRLYRLAQKGEAVSPPEREITVYSLSLNSYQDNLLYVSVSCSKGTYIRSLAHDIGKVLGCGAYLSELKRTSVGSLSVKNALSLKNIEALHASKTLAEHLLSFSQVADYASCSIADDYIDVVFHGKEIQPEQITAINGDYETGDKVAVKDLAGNILAVCKAEIPSYLIDKTENSKLFSYIRVLN